MTIKYKFQCDFCKEEVEKITDMWKVGIVAKQYQKGPGSVLGFPSTAVAAANHVNYLQETRTLDCCSACVTARGLTYSVFPAPKNAPSLGEQIEELIREGVQEAFEELQ